MIKYNLKKKFLSKKEITRLLNYFYKINPKFIRNYGSNRYSKKKSKTIKTSNYDIWIKNEQIIFERIK